MELRAGDAPVIVEYDGGVATITLNEPAKLNPLSEARRAALADAVQEVASRDDIRVVVFRGAGRAFSAGADLRGGSAPAPTWAERRASAGAWQRLLDAIQGLPQVTVARLHGWVVGGAALLAIACDIRVGDPTLRLSIPEVALGLPLTWGGNPRLVREIGLPRARDLVMTARVLDAGECQAWGIVTRLTEEDGLDATLEGLVADLMAMPEAPLAMTKGAFAALGRRGLDMAWADADLISWSMQEPERREAARRYIERTLGRER
jgi:enoyl-CoA hydratase/carnithine racemase